MESEYSSKGRSPFRKPPLHISPAVPGMNRADRLDRVGLGRVLVLTVAFHPGEPEREPGRVLAALLHVAERDLSDDFRANVHRVPVGKDRDFLEAPRLPV